MRKIFQINEDFVNTRLDKWIKKSICDLPQSLIEKNIRKGKIKINNLKKKSSYKLQKNDKIILYNFNYTANFNKKKTYRYIPSKKDLSFSNNLFIDNNENFVVINKPSGISVQSGTKSRKNILDILKYTKEFSGFSPYSVHRIDKETSGLLIVAKNRKYAQLLTSLFRIRKIHKTYLGIIMGEMSNNKGTFRDILLNYEGEKTLREKAITHFSIIDSNTNYSFIKLNPETGRKHQLRKQLFMRNHPILGDSKYRISKKINDKKNNLMLHAYKINFSINNIRYNFVAEPPNDFKNCLKEKNLKNFLL
tara:strand:- start:10340 stop:11257 length:918 start_codon:yes stop_codon:yes gene_type:complete